MTVLPTAGLRLRPMCSAAEARSVFTRRLPGAEVEIESTMHPYWWVRCTVSRTLLRSAIRGRAGGAAGSEAGEPLDVLVDVYTRKGFLAGFAPAGDPVGDEEFAAVLEREPIPVEAAVEVARNLVRTRVQRRWKLGMGYRVEITGPVRGVLKPNWLVAGRNREFAARMLVDGLDGTHYVISAQAL